MSTINDYINWRGDLTFKHSDINNVDLVLLSQLPLLYLENFINEKTSISFQELLQTYYDQNGNKDIGLIIPGAITETLYTASKTPRYKDIIVENFTKIIDDDKTEQFCALTLSLTNNITYIVFSGTDDTITGWKENFHLILDKNTHAQMDAVKYLKTLSKNGSLKGKKIYIGGHSKGGNLAMYAAANTYAKVQNKIIRVYNFDGPGFNDNFFHQQNYLNIADRVVQILPLDSIVGCLFIHREKQFIVNSNARGLMQHNVLSWIIDKTDFQTLNNISIKAHHVDTKIKQLVESLDLIERERFVESLFKILSIDNNKALITLKKHKIAVTRAYLNSGKEEKQIILKLLGYLVKDGIIRNGLINSLLELDRFKKALKAKHKKQTKQEIKLNKKIKK